MPRIADTLPLAVPVPVVLDAGSPDGGPLRVRHRLVPGEACRPSELTAEDGRLVGAFLRALHDTPAAVYAGTGVPDAAATRDHLLGRLADMRERVLPLLPVERRAAGAALLDEVAEPVEACLVHGDLGPTHLLVADERVSGVIDWSDAVIGDPGLDLAWTLNGTAGRVLRRADDVVRRHSGVARSGPALAPARAVVGGAGRRRLPRPGVRRVRAGGRAVEVVKFSGPVAMLTGRGWWRPKGSKEGAGRWLARRGRLAAGGLEF